MTRVLVISWASPGLPARTVYCNEDATAIPVVALGQVGAGLADVHGEVDGPGDRVTVRSGETIAGPHPYDRSNHRDAPELRSALLPSGVSGRYVPGIATRFAALPGNASAAELDHVRIAACPP